MRAGNVDKAANPNVNRAGFSFDGGTNWFQASTEPGGVTGGGNIAAAANASRVVWSPQGAAVHVSTNNGSSWTPSTGIPAGAAVESDRVNPLKFYGAAGGTFYVSTNGGAGFTAAATGLPASARFKAVPGREGDIWLAGGDGGLWRSTDSGASFSMLGNVQEANNIGFGMPAPGRSYPALYSSAQVGGVRGIFRSDDAGANWLRINDDQHQFASTGDAITGDPRIFGRVYVSTNGLGVIFGEPSTVTVPGFTLSAAPNTLSIDRGAAGTSVITIARTGGFSGSVAFSATGLPAGVTAGFNPPSSGSTGTSTTVTVTASSTAAAGAATITIAGAAGALSRTASINVTVNAPPPVDFSLSANPSSVTVNQGAAAASTIGIARTGGFTGGVAFSVTGLPTGVSATFNPTPAAGTSSAVTFNAASTAATGAATVTIRGTAGTLTRTTTIGLTVNAAGGGTGAVTVTPIVSANGPWFNEQLIRVSNTAPLTALSITIVLQRTTGVSFSGQYNTVGGQILQSNSSTPAAVTYQFTLASGQTLGIGTGRTFAAQAGGSGTVHATSGDTYTVTYTLGGATFTQSGHF